jgi:signal transduction histidine kinase
MSNYDANTAISKADALCDKAATCYISNPKEALTLLLQAEALLNKHESNEITYNKILARCLCLQSSAYQRLSEFENANQVALRAISIAEKTNDHKTMANAFRILGSVSFFRGESETALKMYEKGLEYGRLADDKKSLSALLNNIGTVYHHLADYARATRYYNQSLEIYIEIGDKRGEANAYINIGNNYYALGDYANALDYQFKAMKIHEALGDEQGKSIAYSGLALIYEKLGEYQKSIENYQNCLEYEKKSGNRWSMALTLNNLGNVYEAINDYPNALQLYQESLNIKRQLHDRQGIAHTLNNIAELYIKQRQYADALIALNESLETLESVSDKSGYAMSLITMAKLFSEKEFEQYDLDKAIGYLHRSVEIAQEIKAKGVVSDAYRMMSHLYEQKGDAINALHYYKSFHTIEQEIKSEESEKRIQSLSVAYETEKAKKESELRRLEAEKYRLENVELAQANQFKTELLAIAAHDLKNPLQSIMGFAQLIEERKGDSTAIESFAKIIQNSSERMLSLINNLLEDAKAEMTTFELKPETLNLTDFIKQLLETNCNAQAHRKSQTIFFESNGDIILKGDRERLKQVFENLIGNAIKYSPKGKRIWIELRSKQSHTNQATNESVLVSVKDEGQGLTEEDKSKLFGKFQRLSAKPTGGESSTGLGLSITKQLVEKHNGRIWAESEGKDKGTTFFVELPIT